MILEFKPGQLDVIREETDPKFRDTGWASGESVFLHKVKKEMIASGMDVIKKRMWKDGHLVDDNQQYIRMRDSSACWFNDHWAINGLDQDFNTGKAILRKV